MNAVNKPGREHALRQSPEFVPRWDVYRDEQGKPVTITRSQLAAIWHAVDVVEDVRNSEHFESLWDNGRPNLAKSRLLGRMLLSGLPPTKSKPPTVLSGPAWWTLPGGDPFADSSD